MGRSNLLNLSNLFNLLKNAYVGHFAFSRERLDDCE
jgi:hypothetical protein